jgi:hypothetical protein
MHGIVRTRNLKEGTEPSYQEVHRIEARYSDGRIICFVPVLTLRFSANRGIAASV